MLLSEVVFLGTRYVFQWIQTIYLRKWKRRAQMKYFSFYLWAVYEYNNNNNWFVLFVRNMTTAVEATCKGRKCCNLAGWLPKLTCLLPTIARAFFDALAAVCCHYLQLVSIPPNHPDSEVPRILLAQIHIALKLCHAHEFPLFQAQVLTSQGIWFDWAEGGSKWCGITGMG